MTRRTWTRREKCVAAPLVVLLSAGLPAACSADPVDEDGEQETIAVTLWTDSFELFMEYPQLRVGQSARFAAHLTHLNTFAPVTTGPVTFEFLDRGEVVKTVTLEEPLRPGIFVPEVVFEKTALLTLHVVVGEPSDSGTIQVSAVRVSGPEDPVAPIEEVDVRGDEISYLKEQQWKLPFRTEIAAHYMLQNSATLSGKVLAKPDRDFRIVPPRAGRFIPPEGGAPLLGKKVREGQLLGWIEPPLPEPERVAMENAQVQTAVTLTQLEENISSGRARLTQTTSELDLARREFARIEQLFGLEAVSRRRMQTARSDLAIAEANLQAAQENLTTLIEASRQLRQQGSGGDTKPHRLPLYAPGSGTVVESWAAPGAFVSLRQTLFRIVDLSRVWIRAEVHETDLGVVDGASGRARVQLPDGTTVEIGGAGDRLLLIGNVVDSETRTLPVVWEIANRERPLKVGLVVAVQVFTAEERNTLAVPTSAVFREENKSVIYVQVAGETFDRRIVQTGVQDGDLIEVRSGLSAGERVVTDGGYEVGLAARSTSAIGQGHVH